MPQGSHVHENIQREAFRHASPVAVEIREEPHRFTSVAQVPSMPREPRRERHAGPPIRFYHRHQPYYEFTNFASCSVRYNGRRYPTSEHLFQAFKFMETDPRLAEHIRRLRTPRDALREATRLRSRRRHDWFDVNVGVMDMILQAKFTQHPHLRRMLLETSNRELIEDSPVDSFWGVGSDGRGRNELGKALMRVREDIRADTERQRSLQAVSYPADAGGWSRI